jgi:mono/diheme cytochrome c family protein
MKRLPLFLIALVVGVLLLLSTPATQALPEYAAQTGEPCASCHISPSGGGARTPRGQAWVGAGKPGQVPALVEALEILGVKLSVDPADFRASTTTIAPARPLQLKPVEAQQLQARLRSYDGN